MIPAARRLAKSLATVCTLGACCLVVTSCRSSKKQMPTVMDSREVVPSPYVSPQARPLEARPTASVATPRTPVFRPQVSSPPAGSTVSPPRIKPLPKPTPAPVIAKEQPLVTPPPVIAPPAPATGAQFKPVRIIKDTQTPKAIPTAKSNNIIYVVKKGDNLWDIGRAYGVSVKEICNHANVDASKILKIGQKIELPPGARYVPESERPKIKKTAKAPAPRKTAPASRPVAALVQKTGSTSAGKGKYIVQKGDNLWTIARKHGMETNELMTLNNLKNDRLMPGQVLVVDGTTAKSAPPAAVVATPNNRTPAATQPEVVIDVNQGVIKDNGSAAVAPPTAAVIAPTGAASTKNLPHFVVDGDSLANIAEMYGSKVDWIKRENAAINADSDLKPGLRINVPVEDIDR